MKVEQSLGVLLLTAAILSTVEVLAAEPGGLKWRHLTSNSGDLPAPGVSTEQTACILLDIDKDGVDDIVIGMRKKAPALVWYRHAADGWKRYVIDKDLLPLEAGGTFCDIDGDGDLDIVMGEDWSGNKVYWWENPSPNFDPNTPWKRHVIKSDGAKKHHDQLFGDFDGDGKKELVFWNQSANQLCLARIPADPRQTEPWTYTPIFRSASESEGLAAADIDGDGKLELVGGGYWFEHKSGNEFTAHLIDDQQRFTRVAAGQLKKGGWCEVVFVAGEAKSRLKWYEWTGRQWLAHDPLGFDIDHGHSLQIADLDGDGNLDIFVAEMRLDGGNPQSKMLILLGDGKGNFTKTEIGTGYDNHESRVGDVNGDGRLDIVDKPYNCGTPRLDLWLNLKPAGGKKE
jgi:hypothetical protein